MINRFRLCAAIVCLAAMFSGGCCCIDDCGYGGCTSYPGSGGCAGDICGGGCGDTCGGCGYGGGFGLGFLGGLGASCGFGGCSGGTCGIDNCGGCGGCGFDACWGPGPIVGLLGLIRQGLTCGYGCGGVYMDEWCSDPPACCDPCDFGCGGCSDGGCGGGCASGGCGGGGCASYAPGHEWSGGYGDAGGCSDGGCAVHRRSAPRTVARNQQSHQASRKHVTTTQRVATRPTHEPRTLRPGKRVMHMTQPGYRR